MSKSILDYTLNDLGNDVVDSAEAMCDTSMRDISDVCVSGYESTAEVCSGAWDSVCELFSKDEQQVIEEKSVVPVRAPPPPTQ